MTHETAMLLGATAYVLLLVGWLAVMASRSDAKPKMLASRPIDVTPGAVNYIPDTVAIHDWAMWWSTVFCVVPAPTGTEMSRWEDDGGAPA